MTCKITTVIAFCYSYLDPILYFVFQQPHSKLP
nr:MAG TPA: membrane protein [Caudoviricetes sp.]